MRGDVDKVARVEPAGLGLVGETQPGGAGQQHHPFALFLVVPETGWASLAQGDDPLDAYTRAAQQDVDNFARTRVGKR